jgi:hypothetical protein
MKLRHNPERVTSRIFPIEMFRESKVILPSKYGPRSTMVAVYDKELEDECLEPITSQTMLFTA